MHGNLCYKRSVECDSFDYDEFSILFVVGEARNLVPWLGPFRTNASPSFQIWYRACRQGQDSHNLMFIMITPYPTEGEFHHLRKQL